MKPTAKDSAQLLTSVLSAAALLLLGGCSTREMKGSPFYSGEYAVNVPGAETRRMNLWPLAYYREPALSVLWPVFEHTEEHVAVRPLFSAYGDTRSYWEYNLLWPLCQADTKSHDYRIFPCFWGQGKREGNAEKDYHVLFPFVWHYEDKTCTLFPLWVRNHSCWKDDRFTEHDTWLGWPLTHYHTGLQEESWHAALFGRYRNLSTGGTYTGFPWPLFFSWREKEKHGLFTPLYAYETSDVQNVTDGWAALPLLLAWQRWDKADNDLNILLGLFNQHWGDSNRSGYLLPLCAYDRNDRLFLTPLVGWDKPDAKDPAGYWYPLTPLTGLRTGSEKGGWLFPLFDHTSNISNGLYSTRFLLLGYDGLSRHSWNKGHSSRQAYGFFPLFSHSLNTSAYTNAPAGGVTEQVNTSDRQLLLRYSGENRTVCRALPEGSRPETTSTNAFHAAKLRTDYCRTTTSGGIFPLWSSESSLETRLDGTRLQEDSGSSVLLALYDTKRELKPKTDTDPPLDYERRRILWRVWHYEKRNGDVSVDLFPAITYDTHADGFSKTSFLWRLFRYEKHPGGGVDVDLLFLPLKRAR